MGFVLSVLLEDILGRVWEYDFGGILTKYTGVIWWFVVDLMLCIIFCWIFVVD